MALSQTEKFSDENAAAWKADQVRPYCGLAPFRQVIFWNQDG